VEAFAICHFDFPLRPIRSLDYDSSNDRYFIIREHYYSGYYLVVSCMKIEDYYSAGSTSADLREAANPSSWHSVLEDIDFALH
jgi:hypothetical protein